MTKVYQFPKSEQTVDVNLEPWLRVVGVKRDSGLSLCMEDAKADRNSSEYNNYQADKFINRSLYRLQMGKLRETDLPAHQLSNDELWRRHIGSGASNTGMRYGWLGSSNEEIDACIKVRRKTLNTTAKAIAIAWQKQMDGRTIGSNIQVYQTWDPDTVVIREKLPVVEFLEQIWYQSPDVLAIDGHEEMPAIPLECSSLSYGSIILNAYNGDKLRMGNFAGNVVDERDSEFLDRYFMESGSHTLQEDLAIERRILAQGIDPRDQRCREYFKKEHGCTTTVPAFRVNYLEEMLEKHGGKPWNMGFDMRAVDDLNYLEALS